MFIRVCESTMDYVRGFIRGLFWKPPALDIDSLGFLHGRRWNIYVISILESLSEHAHASVSKAPKNAGAQNQWHVKPMAPKNSEYNASCS